MKIDVQGAEYSVLLGASELITRCRPTIVSDFSPDVVPGVSVAPLPREVSSGQEPLLVIGAIAGG